MRQEDLEILSEQNDFSKGVKSKNLKDYLGDKKISQFWFQREV